MPIEALTTSATPRLFRSGPAGDAERGLIGRLLLVALAYGALAAAFVWLVAPLAAILFGRGYEEVGAAARAMALFVPLYGLRVLGANILLARGKIARLAGIQATGVVAMLVLGAWLIPAFGLGGSVYTIISTEILLGILIWMSIMATGKAPRPGKIHPAVQGKPALQPFDRMQCKS